jgi:hypothetical protein
MDTTIIVFLSNEIADEDIYIYFFVTIGIFIFAKMEPNKFSFYGCGITWSEQRDSLFTTTKIAAQRFDTYISTHSRFLRTRIVAGGSTNKFHTLPKHIRFHHDYLSMPLVRGRDVLGRLQAPSCR